MRLEPREDWVYWVLLQHYADGNIRRRFVAEGRPAEVADFLREQDEWAVLEARVVAETLLLQQLWEAGGCLITWHDAAYPAALREAQYPPLALYALGDVSILQEPPIVAFAGSRNASERALEEAQRLARELVDEGYHTVTGFARGVDLTVAETTLARGGKTIGVLAQGLMHKTAQPTIRAFMHALNDDQLLFLSELHLNAPWTGKFAMMRNRIVAALGDLLIVVESGVSREENGKRAFSGTYECARTARKMGRPVYALDLPAEGNQQLIREGIAQVWGDGAAAAPASEASPASDSLDGAAAPQKQQTPQKRAAGRKKPSKPENPSLF
ncbi:MAG: DNA-processing protein DprA [Fimbriimonadales bacterium]|nr:MAG: hypothetical protein KatS3mg018_2107 [Fimbriimonadales bacterium]